MNASLPHMLVLGDGRFQIRVGRRAGMSKLDLGGKHAGARSNGPGDDWLRNGAVLDGFDDTVLLDTANLTEQQQNFALGVRLVAEEMVDEGGAGVSVAANGDTLVDAIGVLGDDVVQLVGHAAGLGHVADGSVAVQLGRDDVVHHAAGVADLERAGFDAADSGRANDRDSLFLGRDHDFASTLKPVRD